MSDSNLVHIHTAPDKATADIIKGLLESNDIKVLIKSPFSYQAFRTATGGVSIPPDSWPIYVLKDKVAEAKKLLENFDKKRKKKK